MPRRRKREKNPRPLRSEELDKCATYVRKWIWYMLTLVMNTSLIYGAAGDGQTILLLAVRMIRARVHE